MSEEKEIEETKEDKETRQERERLERKEETKRIELVGEDRIKEVAKNYLFGGYKYCILSVDGVEYLTNPSNGTLLKLEKPKN